jgi:hypothetical protein
LNFGAQALAAVTGHEILELFSRVLIDKTKQANSRRVPDKMEEGNNNSGSGRDVAYQEVVRILKLKKSWSRRAEMIVAVMSGYEDWRI